MDHDEFIRRMMERAKEHAAFLKELAKAPLTMVEGVITPFGVGLIKITGQKKWDLTLHLRPWRLVGGELRHDRLSVSQELTEKESERAREGLEACGIVTLQVRLAVEKSSGIPQALLVKKCAPTQYDEGLKSAAEELLRPKEYTDAQFGAFTLDRQLNRYATTTEWHGKELSLDLETVSVDDESFSQQALECTRTLWRDWGEWNRKVNAKIVSELLELKNTMWLYEDESPLSEEEFLGALVMHSISITPKGRFTIWYGDGGVFAGHSISVYGDLTEGVRWAKMEG